MLDPHTGLALTLDPHTYRCARPQHHYTYTHKCIYTHIYNRTASYIPIYTYRKSCGLLSTHTCTSAARVTATAERAPSTGLHMHPYLYLHIYI